MLPPKHPQNIKIEPEKLDFKSDANSAYKTFEVASRILTDQMKITDKACVSRANIVGPQTHPLISKSLIERSSTLDHRINSKPVKLVIHSAIARPN